MPISHALIYHEKGGSRGSLRRAGPGSFFEVRAPSDGIGGDREPGRAGEHERPDFPPSGGKAEIGSDDLALFRRAGFEPGGQFAVVLPTAVGLFEAEGEIGAVGAFGKGV